MTVDLIVAYKNVPLYDKINIAEIGVPTSSEDETVPGCLKLVYGVNGSQYSHGTLFLITK
jgi:hypothetical protein